MELNTIYNGRLGRHSVTVQETGTGWRVDLDMPGLDLLGSRNASYSADFNSAQAALEALKVVEKTGRVPSAFQNKHDAFVDAYLGDPPQTGR